MHVNYLPHCNRQALVQFSCPTQRKILSAESQLLSPVMPFYYFSLVGVNLLEKTGKGKGREGRGWRGKNKMSFRLCRVLIHNFASIHGGCSRTFPRTSLLFSNFM